MCPADGKLREGTWEETAGVSLSASPDTNKGQIKRHMSGKCPGEAAQGWPRMSA